MRKIFFVLLFALLSIGAQALEISDGFTYSKDFWNNKISLSQNIEYYLNVGFSFDLTEYEDISNHIYTFSLPIMLRTESFGFFFRPFIIPDNANEASAKGAKLSWTFAFKKDEIEQAFANFFLSVGFADQKAYVIREGQLPQKDNFYQLAYEAGIMLDYYNIYFFEVNGNIFQYLSGISSVEGVAGVLDQQNLASLGTLDYVLGLPKGSAEVKIRWNSQVSQSENSISYRFIEFYDRGLKAHHSVLLSSRIYVGEKLSILFGYNHIFIQGQTDKDIFKGELSVKF